MASSGMHPVYQIRREAADHHLSYNASKAATISLTEQLAVELKNPGLEVRVNTIAPGYVREILLAETFVADSIHSSPRR